MHRCRSIMLFLGIVLCSLSGCWQSGGMILGEVTGTVTLDGKPLPDAMVSYYPEVGGRSAHGVTDAAGRYQLRYTGSKDGAPVGAHRVKVEVGVQSGEGPPKKTAKIPPLPSKYNSESELTADVQRGSNTIDFTLHSN
ncbi:carboxypeptidase-like regulatory domain-containing protein [Blastopirellula sp. J2-11]|uniref:carboxypeptidase-like regulatory domain-containing protein n=1 Tax=Blastopirellula sp. J2-11 TaxID=2943192 RepID=UPI0021C6396A|nr:carboxypeptidase-like regulatory domain-containing protein [Blastopirellula sp. J2-11]UUO08643.1 carboxypeptidase-like regulatory domain-containing protein [Blastopirellula sp. J2-11]